MTDGQYSRIDNVLYYNGTPKCKLLQRFPDFDVLNGLKLTYMKRYIEHNPHLIMRKQVILFYDLETTGTNHKRHSIHQIGGVIEVDGQVVETFDIRTQPHPKAEIDEGALAVAGVTLEEIQAYQPMAQAHQQLIGILSKYVDRYDSQDKIFLSGFNIAGFDDFFLRAWFQQNGDNYFGSWFWNDQLDVRVLAAQYLIKRRHTMPDFKLMTVAKTLGIEVDESKAHDAVYDIMITREVYMVCVGLELEMI